MVPWPATAMPLTSSGTLNGACLGGQIPPRLKDCTTKVYNRIASEAPLESTASVGQTRPPTTNEPCQDDSLDVPEPPQQKSSIDLSQATVFVATFAEKVFQQHNYKLSLKATIRSTPISIPSRDFNTEELIMRSC
ncbi:hypothetical protein quinque_013660 [Culex quinquefasciatus]